MDFTMIITQTPIRISFFGGGTDFEDFFSREGGCVLSSAIDKYIFVIIKERFDDKIRVGYTRTEMVDHLDEIKHELVREALRLTGITHGVEVSTMADIPSAGSGLASSSAVTVGLLNTMHAYLGRQVPAEILARQACQIEIERLGKPIGIQDQYIAAYGGLRFMEFNANGQVDVNLVELTDDIKRHLSARLMLFFTGLTRRAEDVLAEQKANIGARLHILRRMKELAYEAQGCLLNSHFDGLGELLHQGWQLKKQMASGITNQTIEHLYDAAGALGGKMPGAGGGGFLLLYCPPAKQQDVRAALHGLWELPFSLEREGSKVIFNYRR
jgi:D-glycero-alpha-D-manno-heptose-7-phosphate kinase